VHVAVRKHHDLARFQQHGAQRIGQRIGGHRLIPGRTGKRGGRSIKSAGKSGRAGKSE